MSRSSTPYGQNEVRQVHVAGAVSIEKPVAGYYRHKLRSGSVVGGVHLFYGPPSDPVTGEVMDRSWRWQALFDGEFVDFDDVWPTCAGSPITEADYSAYVARREWAKQNAPDSAYAKPGKRFDPLSTVNPMPF